MCEPDGFGPHVALGMRVTKPFGWIFGRLFFPIFFCRQKERTRKMKDVYRD
jgi:hypothetical protein